MGKNICVAGGGNIGTQFACMCATGHNNIKVYSSKPECFEYELEIIDEHENTIKGTILKASDCLKEAVNDSDVIIVTYPAFMLQRFAEDLLPFVKKGMNILVVPGTGGAEFAFDKCIRAGAVMYGLQRVPGVARLEQYGKRVRCEGMRDKLHLASLPCDKAGDLNNWLGDLFGIPCETLPNYLCVTLTPSNPILHTARLRALFEDYQPGKYYERNPLFYGDWNDRSSELLLKCDEELQKVCRKLDKLDLKSVRSLKLHYESDTIERMTEKIRSIKSLHNLGSPMKQTDNGWVPDFSSRYFTADFPFGLNLLAQFADITRVDAPCIHETLEWYQNITNDMSGIKLSEFEVKSVDDIYSFYKN